MLDNYEQQMPAIAPPYTDREKLMLKRIERLERELEHLKAISHPLISISERYNALP